MVNILKGGYNIAAGVIFYILYQNIVVSCFLAQEALSLIRVPREYVFFCFFACVLLEGSE